MGVHYSTILTTLYIFEIFQNTKLKITPYFSSCVSLGKSLNLSEPRFADV